MQGRIGVQIFAPDAAALLGGIVHAEELGIPAAWLTTGSAAPDGLTVLAAAAARTSRILMGTAITPTFPRHPLVTAQQALAVASLAPGRLRLGVGPSGKGIERIYGIPYERPVAHLRAYVKVLKGLLQEGAVDVEEAGVIAHARLPGHPPGVPVLASALQRRSFKLCGEIADGAITWVCPAAYIRDAALPAFRMGAKRAGRDTPPLVMHVPVCLSEDRAIVREAVRQRFNVYTRLPHYLAMFAAAGFPEAQQGEWSDAMIDAVVVHGSEATVTGRLRDLLAMGASELMVSPVAAGPDAAATIERTLRLIGNLAAAFA